MIKCKCRSERDILTAELLLVRDEVVVVSGAVSPASVAADLYDTVGNGIDDLIVVRGEENVAAEGLKPVVDGGYRFKVKVVGRLVENQNI